MLDLRLDAAPANSLLDVATCKAHVRYAAADQDALVSGFIAAVTAYLDGFDGILKRCLITQTWKLSLPCFPPRGAIELPLPPLQDVVLVEYLDTDGQTQTLDPSLYVVQSDPLGLIERPLGVVWPFTLPRNSRAVTVTFKAGYGDEAADVPAPILAAATLMFADLFVNREGQVIEAGKTSVVENPTVKRLLAPYRILRT